MATKKTEQPVKKSKKTVTKDVGNEKKFQLSQIRQFVAEVKAEFGKIAWPNKKHTVGSTVVVTIFVFLVSFYLGAVDLVVGKIVSTVLR